MARTNRTRYTILGALTHRAMSGYDVKQFIEQSIGNFWRESYGQIYPTLKSLESEGLVDKETRAGKGRPDRNIYSLTSRGREVLRAWLLTPAESEIPRHELLLKLFFGAEVGAEDNLAHIARYRDEATEALHKLRGTADQLGELHPENEGLPFWLLGVRLGSLVNDAVLAWCDEADAVLRGEKRAQDLFTD